MVHNKWNKKLDILTFCILAMCTMHGSCWLCTIFWTWLPLLPSFKYLIYLLRKPIKDLQWSSGSMCSQVVATKRSLISKICHHSHNANFQKFISQWNFEIKDWKCHNSSCIMICCGNPGVHIFIVTSGNVYCC